MPKTKSEGPKESTSKSDAKKGSAKRSKKPATTDSGKAGTKANSASPPALEAQAGPPFETAEPEAPPEHLFPIVGVGASAGGLEAFTKLLENLPLDTGMGFVLVQHMAARAHSMLPEILAKTTRMPVTEVVEGMKVEPNNIYVTPPDIIMTLQNGVLHLATRVEPRGQNRPIDIFLRSLGKDQGGRAIGVILSGTASDGVLGLQVIKAEGGITFAQDLKTAKYTGMPESAIAAGVVDFVLSPEKIAWHLAHHPLVATPFFTSEVKVPAEEDGVFNQILLLLKAATGVDFTYYKHSTIKRRIQRRMMLKQVEKLEDYVRCLRENVEEVKSLYEDILINVTSFFREPEAFEALQKMVFPEIRRNRAEGGPIRIWVPGCATGEEAYSLAISLLEFLGDMANNVQIQIFATDIEDGVIDKARLGIYSEAISEDVSTDRLRRFFVKIPGGYQVSKTIRSMCVFAKQNLIKDPPFSRLDLISCRNVLIYFGPVLQKKVIPIFHFALKSSGFLMLGKSEALGVYPDLFTLMDKKLKIFLRKGTSSPHLMLPFIGGAISPAPAPFVKAASLAEQIVSPAELQQEADRMILARFAPAGVIIDSNLNIIHFRGHTGMFLEPAPGEASLNLIKMAREGLQIELRAAVHAALKSNTLVRQEGVRLRHNGGMKTVNLEVFPLRPAAALERYFLVVFEAVTRLEPAPVKEAAKERTLKGKPATKDREIAELTSELTATKEYLQAVIEEQETSVEELKSSNEELMSANEELQSINEEMETSKEELQSANEELATLNEEMDNRNQELSQANNDLNNLLTAVQIAIVMLGPDLRIRRFNPVAQEMLNLIPADRGRPIGDLKLPVEAPDLEAMIHEVLEHLVIREKEVRDREGRWYSLRLRPYRTMDNKIDGIVLALVNVDALKRSLQEAQAAREYAWDIIATLREPLIVLDGDLRVISANESFYRTFQVPSQETEGRRIYELGNQQWDIPRLRELLETILPADQQFQDFEVEHDFPGIGHRTMLLNARRLVHGDGGSGLILLAIEDMTDSKQAVALKESEAKLQDLNRKVLALQDQERQELSWELQEDLAQNITALKLKLWSFEPKLPENDAQLRQEYRQILDGINGIVEALRHRAMDLSPNMLEDLGLNSGLKSLCENFYRSAGIDCETTLDDLDQFFSKSEQTTIYRVFQEALNNVGRHAQASKVTLFAKKGEDRVDFLVEDNGQGFDVGREEDLVLGRQGIGLATMAERVRGLGGTFEVESQPGVGTRIFFSLPKGRE
jgi:two-component system, chemotaxis family, CheB/CheR fusion protein